MLAWTFIPGELPIYFQVEKQMKISVYAVPMKILCTSPPNNSALVFDEMIKALQTDIHRKNETGYYMIIADNSHIREEMTIREKLNLDIYKTGKILGITHVLSINPDSPNSYRFRKGDIFVMPKLLDFLSRRETKEAKRVYDFLVDDCKKAVDKYKPNSNKHSKAFIKKMLQLEPLFIDGLNKILINKDFYDKATFKDLHFTPEEQPILNIPPNTGTKKKLP